MSRFPPGIRIGLWVWLVLMVLTSVLAGIMWYLTPLAMGFSQAAAPTDPEGFAQLLFRLSWHIGLPLLALGQVAALILARRHLSVAAALATAVLAVFLGLAGGTLALW